MEGVSLVNAESKQERPQDKERTLLDRFREGPAGALARGFALMTALALGEGCDGETDSLHESMKQSRTLSEAQRSLPHRDLFEFLDSDSESSNRIDFAGQEAIEEYIFMHLVKDQLTPETASEVGVARFSEDEINAAIEAFESTAQAPVPENDVIGMELKIAWNTYYEQYRSLHQRAREAVQNDAGTYLPRAKELDAELYGYADRDANGELSDDELFKAYRMRYFGYGPGAVARVTRMLESHK